MEEFDCTAAGRAIAAYVDELSNWYVRLSRRRLWEGERTALAVLRHCLVEVAKLLAPFVPFLADEIHGNLAGEAGPAVENESRRPLPHAVASYRSSGDIESEGAVFAHSRPSVTRARMEKALLAWYVGERASPDDTR